MMTKKYPALIAFSLVFLLLAQYSVCETVHSVFRIENTSREVLFDINAEILEKEIKDDYMNAKVTLINFGEPGEVETTVNYTIKDSEGREVYTESEKVNVLTQKEYIKTFDMSGLDNDEYVIVMDLEYRGQIEPAMAEESFVVSRTPSTNFYLFFTTILVVSFISIVFYWKMNPRNIVKTS